MKAFRKGDIVCCTVHHSLSNERIDIGSVGTICEGSLDCDTQYPEEYQVAVEWDDYVAGHTCCGACKKFHGWFVPVRYLELLSDEDGFDPSLIDDLANIL